MLRGDSWAKYLYRVSCIFPYIQKIVSRYTATDTIGIRLLLNLMLSRCQNFGIVSGIVLEVSYRAHHWFKLTLGLHVKGVGYSQFKVNERTCCSLLPARFIPTWSSADAAYTLTC
jgi:hypothetical protein